MLADSRNDADESGGIGGVADDADDDCGGMTPTTNAYNSIVFVSCSLMMGASAKYDDGFH